ncbi:hypothetical protein [Xylocopilactobacillus apicola]|uniref:Uncharacterized protein n=1 Tax=Xylocopilactobacillus apicola TaxID=2932184 RepID=A0AAU9DRW8_9LACO|nr:hypothetical protein [Xylocopilactobacillus apicola]BDR58729.1 hypothetical protein XA3_11700 [Xylocopilactobacillus apicola]
MTIGRCLVVTSSTIKELSLGNAKGLSVDKIRVPVSRNFDFLPFLGRYFRTNFIFECQTKIGIMLITQTVFSGE